MFIELKCDTCPRTWKAKKRVLSLDGKLRCPYCAYLRDQAKRVERKRIFGHDDWLKQTYGVTAQQYSKILLDQNGVCAVCQLQDIGNMPLDHNHSTGKIRGILCQKCNRGLGHFKDSPALLRKAAEYLESNDG